jgi:hypothetical protein
MRQPARPGARALCCCGPPFSDALPGAYAVVAGIGAPASLLGAIEDGGAPAAGPLKRLMLRERKVGM